jgi:nucleoside-diphosphate-sugar epimerase
VAVDLTDAAATRVALAGLRPSHLFFCTWSRQADEAGNIRVNGAMLRNVLDALQDAPLEHAALVTGLKHYLGPFEAYAQTKPDTPFVEAQERLPYDNFYYEQEDILFAAAERRGFTWSVHRPHTMIGWALGNAMNMGVTLAVYGSICRETGRPFVFPGSPEQYEGVTDVTDARLLARQLEWAATTPAAADEAFNIVNGDVFRWKRMWGVLAAGIGVEAAPYPGHATPLEEQMRDAGPIWDSIVARHGLSPFALDTLASWWHTDADLGRTLETFTGMGKSRRFGFLDYQDSAESFLDVIDRLRAARVIPA